MMLGRRCTMAIGALITGCILALGMVNVQAASACKGLEQATCEGNSKCSWVKGYTRKDGAKVSNHCKSKPKSKSDSKS